MFPSWLVGVVIRPGRMGGVGWWDAKGYTWIHGKITVQKVDERLWQSPPPHSCLFCSTFLGKTLDFSLCNVGYQYCTSLKWHRLLPCGRFWMQMSLKIRPTFFWCYFPTLYLSEVSLNIWAPWTKPPSNSAVKFSNLGRFPLKSYATLPIFLESKVLSMSHNSPSGSSVFLGFPVSTH